MRAAGNGQFRLLARAFNSEIKTAGNHLIQLGKPPAMPGVI